MSSRNDRGKHLRKLGKKTRVLIPKPLRERLARVLALAASSPRIDMLAGVQPFALMPAEFKQGVRLPEDTLQQLLERGAPEICKLEGMGPQLLEALVQQLAKMLGLEAADLDPPASSHLSPSPGSGSGAGNQDARSSRVLVPIRGSIDAEVQLNDCFARLRTCPALAAARDRQLKDFWDSSWPRAPFEEQFTLGQIANTKPEMLLKKRSFGPNKIAALIAAVDRFLERSASAEVTTPGASDSKQEPTTPNTTGSEDLGPRNRIHLVKGAPGAFKWHPEPEVLSFVIASVLRGYEHAAVALSAQHPLKSFLEKVPSSVHAQDFANLLLAAELARSASAMLGDDPAFSAALPQRAQTRCLLAVRKLFKSEAPEVYAHWEGMLRLPATKFSLLLEPYVRRASEREFTRTLGYALAASLLVRTPVVWGIRFSGYASMQQSSLEKFFNLILAKLPCSHEVIGSEFEMLLSGVDSSLLFECLKQRAYFDKHAKVWRRIGLVPDKKGT